LVLNPWNLDQLEDLESETGKRVFTILQLRVHPALSQLRDSLLSRQDDTRYQVNLTYITARGPWYRYSWKGDDERSGGLATNIGVHFFDLLMWLFGEPRETEVHIRTPSRCGGFLGLERADVTWFLSIQHQDLPFNPRPGERTTFRSITVDGHEIEFTSGFADLHTRVYEETLAGAGFGIADARPSIQVVHAIRTLPTACRHGEMHAMTRQIGDRL
jgi:UDP-N-acetyl-2-amino-2-deoxyglucuronate dehydrogenase